MNLYLYDPEVIYVIPPSDSEIINFQHRSTTINGTDPVTMLYRIEIGCVKGRVSISAAWPGMNKPFSAVLTEGESLRRGWLVDPLPLNGASDIKIINLHEDEAGSSSSSPGLESQITLRFWASFPQFGSSSAP